VRLREEFRSVFEKVVDANTDKLRSILSSAFMVNRMDVDLFHDEALWAQFEKSLGARARDTLFWNRRFAGAAALTHVELVDVDELNIVLDVRLHIAFHNLVFRSASQVLLSKKATFSSELSTSDTSTRISAPSIFLSFPHSPWFHRVQHHCLSSRLSTIEASNYGFFQFCPFSVSKYSSVDVVPAFESQPAHCGFAPATQTACQTKTWAVRRSPTAQQLPFTNELIADEVTFAAK